MITSNRGIAALAGLALLVVITWLWHRQHRENQQVDRLMEIRHELVTRANEMGAQGLDLIQGCLTRSRIEYRGRPACVDHQAFDRCINRDEKTNSGPLNWAAVIEAEFNMKAAAMRPDRWIFNSRPEFWDVTYCRQ